jgi:hypothetical protein
MPGAFRLLDQTGEELPHSWNDDSLKRYYPWESRKWLDLFFSIFFGKLKLAKKCKISNHWSISGFENKNNYFFTLNLE